MLASTISSAWTASNSSLDDVESGSVERLRQAALYVDHDGTNLLLPGRRITRDDALFYTVMAGELMAEVLGIVPETWTICSTKSRLSRRPTVSCAVDRKPALMPACRDADGCDRAPL